MIRIILKSSILTCILLTGLDTTFASHPEQDEKEQPAEEARIKPDPKLKGWDYFYKIMVESGAEPKYLREVIADRRMPPNKELYFKLKPKESKYMYRKHDTASARRNALKFYRKHKESFNEASKQFGVHPGVILSILQVETKCGNYTGNLRAFHRLARLSSAADVPNIISNLKQKQKADKTVHYRDVYSRAKWLEDEFLPHALATLKLAETKKIHPLEVKGSPAGAIGLFQFLPGNVFKFGIDGNQDQTIDPFHPEDAIPSIANYLASFGWDSKVKLGDQNHRQTIWHYNRSKAYIDTVLGMAKRLEKNGVRPS